MSRHFGDLDAVLAFDAHRKTLPSTVPRWGTVAVLSALEEADAAIIMARADATGRTKREKLVCKSCAEPAYDLVAMLSREAAHVFEVGRQPEAGPAPMTFWVIGICNGLVDVTERRDAIIND